jgi:hypothetical protein
VPAETSSPLQHVHAKALRDLTQSAVANIPRVDFASISVRHKDQSLQTVAATDPVAKALDAVQYQLREGPCYAAVTGTRLVLVNDVTTTTDFPRFGASAAELGVGSQLAIQILHDGERGSLNLYARTVDAFDLATVQMAELFSTQAAAVLDYATQVEQLGEALHTRTDIATAVGIVMERYDIDRQNAFSFLVRHSNSRNIKLRTLAQQVIDDDFDGR